VTEPIIFKSEDIGFGNVCANLDLARQMVRSGFSKGKYHFHGELRSPGNRRDEPVKLFKKRGIMHITPSVASPFERKLNQPQVFDNVIED
jgi:hypothetical protein